MGYSDAPLTAPTAWCCLKYQCTKNNSKIWHPPMSWLAKDRAVTKTVWRPLSAFIIKPRLCFRLLHERFPHLKVTCLKRQAACPCSIIEVNAFCASCAFASWPALPYTMGCTHRTAQQAPSHLPDCTESTWLGKEGKTLQHPPCTPTTPRR